MAAPNFRLVCLLNNIFSFNLPVYPFLFWEPFAERHYVVQFLFKEEPVNDCDKTIKKCIAKLNSFFFI